jgi:hypothetical protein
MNEKGMSHIWGKDDMCTGFWWRNLSKRDHLEDVDIMGRIILKWMLKK